jgi:hypothetical protein
LYFTELIGLSPSEIVFFLAATGMLSLPYVLIMKFAAMLRGRASVPPDEPIESV